MSEERDKYAVFGKPNEIGQIYTINGEFDDARLRLPLAEIGVEIAQGERAVHVARVQRAQNDWGHAFN